MTMEADRNPVPEIVPFPKLQRAAEFIKGLFRFFPGSAPDYMSTHFKGGADELLLTESEVTYTYPEIPTIERPASGQLDGWRG